MDLLDYIIKYMNNKVEATSSLFTKTYGLSEIAQSGNTKTYAHYIGNGQLEPVTNFDAHNGTLFWIRRGDTSVSADAPALLKDASCKNYVVLSYPLRAVCVVKKSHLPCDNATAIDQVAQEMLHKLGGKDKALRSAIGAISLAINPSGYTVNVQGLPLNKEYAAFGLDYTISIVFPQSCIPDLCDDIALPPTPSPTPRKGTIIVQDEGVVVSSEANTLNFVGNGVVATLESPGVVRITISGGGGGGSILLQTDGVNNGSQTVLNLKEGSNVTLTDDGVGGVTIAASGGGTAQVNSDWNAVSGVAEILNKPNLATVATSGSYTDLINQPSIPAAQVNSDWNSVAGVSEILNKPTIPAAQIQSDWTQANNAAVDFIKNKPSIPSITGLVPYTGATQDVDLGVHGLDAHDVTVSHPSGSGVAVSITKGGAGEALTVVKTSGSGNAASITGGVTLISDLHLTTDLADAYIASAATWNAKQDAITLTTTGTSGAATLIGSTLNIPEYSGGGGGGAVDSVNGQTGVVVLDTDDIADTATNRYTNDTDITRLANTSGTNTGDQDLSGLATKSTTINTNAPLSGGGDLSANRTLSISQASGSTDGYLSSTDFNTFNGKLSPNTPITGDTKTKITYDADGLVTAGADAAIADITGLQTELNFLNSSAYPYVKRQYLGGNAAGAMVKVPTADILFIANTTGNNVFSINSLTGALLFTTTINGVTGLVYVPVGVSGGEEVWGFNATTTIWRFNALTGALITSAATGSLTTSCKGLVYVSGSPNRVYAFNATTMSVINASTQALIANIAITGSTTGSYELIYVSSGVHSGLVVGTSNNGIFAVDTTTNTVAIAATNFAASIAASFSVKHVPSLDVYVLCAATLNRVAIITPTASPYGFTLSQLIYGMIRPTSVEIDDVDKVAYVATYAGQANTNIIITVIELLTYETVRARPISSVQNTTTYTQIDTVNKYIYVLGSTGVSSVDLLVYKP